MEVVAVPLVLIVSSVVASAAARGVLALTFFIFMRSGGAAEMPGGNSQVAG